MPRRALILFLAAATLFLLPACTNSDRSTPEATIASARKLVEEGHADKLGSFIYADSQNMRRLMNRFGVFLGNLQKLAAAVQEKFPKEVADLKAKTAAAAKSGKASSLLSQVTSQFRPQAGKRRKPPDPAQANQTRDAFNDAMKQLFVDPYAWLRDSETRLTTTFLTDDSVALLWDDEPVMAPIGMLMKKDADGRWCFMLPLNVPGISGFVPKTDKEFQVIGGLIKVFDNMVIDLTKEVKAGHVHTLEDLSHKAGEMAFGPAVMIVFAYSKLEESKKAATSSAPPPTKPTLDATPAPVEAPAPQIK